MWEILRKNTKGQVMPPAGDSVPEHVSVGAASTENTLKWRRIGEGVSESSKGPVLRIENGRYYVYDRRSGPNHTAHCIGAFDDKQTAIDFVRLL